MQSLKRKELVELGYIIEPPVVKRPHNRHRKDVALTPEQIDSLQNTEKLKLDNYKLTEKEILRVLRKKYKHYKFIETHKISCN
jgi:hypothetical protein